MQNFKLRTKLLAIAVPPLAILALLVAYALKVAFLDGELDGAEVQADLGIFGLAGLAGLLASALVLILVTRSVTGPLGRLTSAADELSNVRLPALVELLRHPGDGRSLAPVELLGVESDDELGRLASALDSVQVVTGEVTLAQRDVVRERVGVLVVNLARRNQILLDRQLELIDQLEVSEQHPDRLEDLYRLDHLATRMRRNAESLLVLAGGEPPRRRGAPVELVDVLRVAMGEIEDYRHVEVGGVQDGLVPSNVAVDLSHLLSELMENATQFSPPDVPVVVEGGRTGDGTYTVSIIDRGIGMGELQIDEANALLDDPPELGLDLSRSLGFLVIGRLAQRLGVDVSLQPTPGGGVTATVAVPAALLIEAAPEAPVPFLEPAAPGADTARLRPGAPSAPPARPAPSPADHPVLPGAGSDDELPWEAQPAVAALFGNEPIWGIGDDLRSEDAPERPVAEEGQLDADPEHRGEDGTAAEGTVAPLPWFRHQLEICADPTRPAGAAAPPPLPDAGELTFPPDLALPGPDVGSGTGPRRLSEAIPEGAEFERGVAALLDPEDRLEPGEGRPTGLPRRRRGEQAPTEQPGRPVSASGRSPEEIREMLARYREGVKHRRPQPGAEPQPHEPPTQEDDR